MNFKQVPVYVILAFLGVGITAWLWGRVSRRGDVHDRRLTIIYFAGLAGALVGAKIAFLIAEGAVFADDWLALFTGRSITGGLLGGFAAVEYAKTRLRYTTATGDVFAILIPISLILGRLGCLHAGCCPGIPCEPHWWTLTDTNGTTRWPAAAAELIFNAGFLVWTLFATVRTWQPGNRFHVYLIAYGIFRFTHEFARDDQRWIGPLGGYHLFAAMMVVVGSIRYSARRRAIRDGRLKTLSSRAE